MFMYPKEEHGVTVFERDTKFRELHFWQQYRCAFVKFIMNNFVNISGMLDLTQKIQDRNEEYISENRSPILRWMKETYIFSDNDDSYIKLCDVFDEYKISESYKGLNYNERRALTKASFIKEVLEQNIYKRYYRAVWYVGKGAERMKWTNLILNFKKKS